MKRGQFYSKTDAYRIKKPVWACLKCGWFTTEGKTRDCQDCHNEAMDHFDSSGEYFEWKRLQLLEKCGEISKLERQVRFDFFAFAELSQKPVQIFFYKADFRYVDKKGNIIVRDYKPAGEFGLDGVFKLKRRAMKLVYGIEVVI